jgi:hypothetical protein
VEGPACITCGDWQQTRKPCEPNHQEYGKTGVHHEAIGSDGHEEAAGTDGKESNEAFGRRPSNKEKKVGLGFRV